MLQSQASLIVARFALSLDGFSAATDGSHEVPASAADVDAVAMGRTTFDRAIDEPRWPWPGLDVQVLTSRPLPERDFETSVVAHAKPAPMAEELRGYGRGVLLLGGPRTIQALIDLGAVDRMEILLLPVLFGDGVPLALEGTPTRPLRLTATKTYPDGAAQLTYEFE